MSSSNAAVSWQERPGVGRTVLVGCSIGAVVAFAVVLTGGIVGGLGSGPSLGLAVFAAFWGGMGFGGMLGGAAGLIQAERRDAAEAI